MKPLEHLSLLLALLGGLVLMAMAALVTVSVLGRWGFNTPVWGDVELVQMGTAVAIALFLPYAQLQRAHIQVDFFTQRVSVAARARLDALGTAALGLICLVLAWCAAMAVLEMRASGETTMVLGLPLWTVYVAMVLGLAVTGLIALASVAKGANSAQAASTQVGEGTSSPRSE